MWRLAWRGGAGWGDKGGVVAQDSGLKAPELRARGQAHLGVEHCPEPLVCVERVGLAARSVEGEDELRPQAFPERVKTDQCLEFTGQPSVAPEDEFGVGPPLDGHQSELLQPG